MKIGLLGGTFNPVHIGHLIIAQYVLQEFQLDCIHFIPTYESAYKEQNNNVQHRKKMVQLAIKNNKKFILNDIELKSKELSYTYKTLKKIHNKKDLFYLIIGNEWLPKFHKWQHYKEIFNFANLIIVKRTDKNIKIPHFLVKQKNKILISDNPVIEISSTLIREFVKKSINIKYLVPGKVDEYIKKYKLYK